MTPERWAQVKAVLARALDKPADSRQSFVDSACRGDPELRDEIVSLLAEAPRLDDFLSRPSANSLGELIRSSFEDGAAGARDMPQGGEENARPNAISPGQELLEGRLLVLEVLGFGSTGVVYRAEDRRLGRQVAVKALHTFDADRLYQLKREFRTLARLSHPNLVQLYELGAHGDLWFLIMELVHGMELGRWLRARPVRDRVLHVFSELFEGLRVLHAAGHMHRDVKPSNVMVTPDDHAVLLDFGLAAPILEYVQDDGGRHTGLHRARAALERVSRHRGGLV